MKGGQDFTPDWTILSSYGLSIGLKMYYELCCLVMSVHLALLISFRFFFSMTSFCMHTMLTCVVFSKL